MLPSKFPSVCVRHTVKDSLINKVNKAGLIEISKYIYIYIFFKKNIVFSPLISTYPIQHHGGPEPIPPGIRGVHPEQIASLSQGDHRETDNLSHSHSRLWAI